MQKHDHVRITYNMHNYTQHEQWNFIAHSNCVTILYLIKFVFIKLSVHSWAILLSTLMSRIHNINIFLYIWYVVHHSVVVPQLSKVAISYIMHLFAVYSYCNTVLSHLPFTMCVFNSKGLGESKKPPGRYCGSGMKVGHNIICWSTWPTDPQSNTDVIQNDPLVTHMLKFSF